MRLPDDYEDHGGGLTPTVISAIVAVTIFVAVILTVVLIMNRQPTSHQQNNTAAQTENVQQAGNQQTAKYPDTQDLITGRRILFLLFYAFTIHFLGHFSMQAPQPTHFSGSMTA